MTVHRRSRAVGIVRRDGGDDGRVIANGPLGEIGRVEMLLQPPPQLGALVPQAFDDELERAVAGGLGEAQVEVAVLGLARGEIVDAGFEPLDALAQRVGVVRRRD